MPRQRKQEAHPNQRRKSRAVALPDVPVVVPTSGDAKPTPETTQSPAQPNEADERIRRMIEAAYT